MKISIENQIEKLNREIKETKELLKLFLNGDEYYQHKIKKLKIDSSIERLENLKEDDLKRKLETLTKNVRILKNTKPMCTIYNDGSDDKKQINTEQIQQFILSSFNINLPQHQNSIGLIKNSDKIERISVFLVEDARLSKLILEDSARHFEHHIQFNCEESWIQNLLKVNMNTKQQQSISINMNLIDQQIKQMVTDSDLNQPVQQPHVEVPFNPNLINNQIINSQILNHCTPLIPTQVLSHPLSPPLNHSLNHPLTHPITSQQIVFSPPPIPLNLPPSPIINPNPIQHHQPAGQFEPIQCKPIQSKIFQPKRNKNQPYTRLDLLLSVRQMIRENYPLPFQGSPIKKTTKSLYGPVNQHSPMFAIDCEMCKTERGELDVTRISLVDEALNVLLDEFVKPTEKIIDYLTPYSGITKEHLENVTTTLEDIHARLEEILPNDAILIGHSLNCDLTSLQLSHPYIIDTSCIYNFSIYFNCKPSLKQLASCYLNNKIQDKNSGHCSIEDAIAAMQLVKLKLSKDVTFGDNRFINQTSKLTKPVMTLTEFFNFNKKFDIKIVYDYLELENLPKFISVTSKHLNKLVDKIGWALSLSNSICIVILKGRLMISLNN